MVKLLFMVERTSAAAAVFASCGLPCPRRLSSPMRVLHLLAGKLRIIQNEAALQPHAFVNRVAARRNIERGLHVQDSGQHADVVMAEEAQEIGNLAVIGTFTSSAISWPSRCAGFAVCRVYGRQSPRSCPAS